MSYRTSCDILYDLVRDYPCYTQTVIVVHIRFDISYRHNEIHYADNSTCHLPIRIEKRLKIRHFDVRTLFFACAMKRQN